MISHGNYMERIVDYYDGKLSLSESDALMDFLEMNPALHEEFLMFGEAMPESATEAPLRAPASLHAQLKSIPDNVFVLTDELLVAYAEKDLDAFNIKKVEEATDQNPQRKRDLEIISAARYEADEAISFPYKNKLLRKEPVVFSLRRMMYYTSAAAAIFILVFFLWPASSHKSGIQSDSHVFANLHLINVADESSSDNNSENPSESQTYYYQNAPQLADNTTNSDRNHEHIATMSPRQAGQLQEITQMTTGNIDDVRNEYLALYDIIEMKNTNADNSNPQTGTLTAWKDWGKGILNGESSIANTPADISLRDVATFSYSNISRFASESLSLSQK
ncbi:MAG: hypothetical protein A2W93_05310 [Bacteroidetes bacterium GWF2_43_63]|nr:MAG: hypothetical protein A2W94_11840 [Bacteroidetes bacterium GWE2_42_42]OFY56292.1 MAG: hypothetical protein A2W93_05310 [Bacteroidetes bacterium GWF2_43_63]HBG71972.1 hypothetical protein [Bacteroidales bacterium]HCB61873.1 hypothetical protein [Bacteroidales bacterium]HCY23895.1 hypothetical protein [Bacteroidales bacterium]